MYYWPCSCLRVTQMLRPQMRWVTTKHTHHEACVCMCDVPDLNVRNVRFWLSHSLWIWEVTTGTHKNQEKKQKHTLWNPRENSSFLYTCCPVCTVFMNTYTYVQEHVDINSFAPVAGVLVSRQFLNVSLLDLIYLSPCRRVPFLSLFLWVIQFQINFFFPAQAFLFSYVYGCVWMVDRWISAATSVTGVGCEVHTGKPGMLSDTWGKL